MAWTVLLTVVSGVITFLIGQLMLKLLLEPVQDFKKTIGLLAHALIYRANVISNPGVPTEDVMSETSKELRSFSAQLHAHLHLIPCYKTSAKLFSLPSKEQVLAASTALIGLSNSVYRASEKVYEVNAKRVECICDSLGIYLDAGARWPKN